MIKNLIKIILIFLLIISGRTELKAQSMYFLQSENSHIIITGTSTVHDWHMDLKAMKGNLKGDVERKEISSVNFRCKSEDLVSDNSIMNSKAQNALKSKKYPEITFSSNKITYTKTGNSLNGTASGTIFIAGVRKSIEITFTGIISNPKISVSGSKKILMSDFNMESPTAMLGALKTGDEINIEFNVVYKLK